MTMRVYADTSFLASLYLRDTNSAAALAWLRTHKQALAFTPLQQHELRNAIRLAVFRKLVTDADALTALSFVEKDVAAGNLVVTPLDWTAAMEHAERVGQAHTATLGIRSLDLLHIGAALSLGAKEFLTFDGRQHAAAAACKFRVLP